ncbi:hypothetical protein B0J14DRAFT_605513 [Halenospora varia]|nr:hypothetical protein B0J14DRAFT_605513 [Halenospora varia]
MEDPWSSPWADEIQEIQPAEPNIPKATSNVAPRPATPIQTTSVALQQHTNSPWNDEEDDEFGGWAAVPTQTGVGLDGANDEWDINAAQTPLEQVTNEFSTAWSQSLTKEEDPVSKLAPSLLPKDVDVVRQPSPDPWAFAMEEPEALSDHVTDERIAGSEDMHKVADLEDHEHVEEPYAEAQSVEKDDVELVPATHIASLGQPAVEDWPTIDIQHDGGTSEEQSKSVAREQKDTEAEEVEGKTPAPESAVPTPAAEPVSSRSSSSHSEHSHHNEAFPESPRTSLEGMEEEPKRPKLPRKVSKVKELVEHFDTLAKPEEDLGLASGRSSAAGGRIVLAEEPADEMDDFGDFEEGQSDDEEPMEQTSPELAIPKTRAPKSRNVEPESFLPKAQDNFDGPLEFTPNLSLLDKILPGTEEQIPVEKVFIPDTVPHDSFTSTEQRKTWYRVSRYGPMRKHNTGDDENYVRVNWIKSEVRTDTLKIVARWIEEDRISGRVVLGGGSKAGSIFGWNDAKSKPASISAAFATKVVPKKPEPAPVQQVAEIPREWPKGLVRERSTSKGRSSITQRRSSVKSAKIVEESKSAQSPVASFGWNTIPEPEKRSSAQPPHTKRPSDSISSTSSPAENSPQRQRRSSSRQSSSHILKALPADVKLQPIIAPPNTIPATKPSSPKIGPGMPLAPIQRQISLEDDEWGEMVASPVIAAPPILPSPILPQSNGLRHKKSQSFGGAMTSAAQPTEVPRSSLQSTRDHRTTVSFDQILTPESWSPQSANPSKIEGTIPSSSAFNDLSSIFNQHSKKPIAPPTPSTSADPWASADFSFFDTAPATAPAPASKPAFPQPPSKGPMSAPPKSTAALVIGPIPTKTVSFASTRSRATSSVATTPRSGKSNGEMEQDRIVQSVIRGLPDLSYMLKR